MQATVLTAVSAAAAAAAAAAEFPSKDSRELSHNSFLEHLFSGEIFHAAFRNIVFSIVPVMLLPFCP